LALDQHDFLLAYPVRPLCPGPTYLDPTAGQIIARRRATAGPAARHPGRGCGRD
jgi:hypothetical protein